jgi:hypothetical protein
MSKTTHFGFQTVAEDDKAKHVASVFTSVASKYDIMNDLMSVGLHRIWKRFAVGLANVHEGNRVLDVAGGSADLSRLFLKKVGAAAKSCSPTSTTPCCAWDVTACSTKASPHQPRNVMPNTCPFPTIILIASASPSACATSPTKMPRCAKCTAYSNREVA